MSKKLRQLPRINRIDPSQPAPEIQDDDAQTGILNLINRGLVKPGLDITPAFTDGEIMLKNRQKPIHLKTEAVTKSRTLVNTSNFNLANLRFDLNSVGGENPKFAPQPSIQMVTKKVNLEMQLKTKEDKNKIDVEKNNNEATSAIEEKLKSINALNQNVDKIRNYNELLDKYSVHQFIIRKGKALRTTPEFLSFQRTNKHIWGSITTIILLLENLLSNYSIPLAYINGQTVATIAMDDIDSMAISTDSLLECILNREEVNSLITSPGQRFKGPNKEEIAATTIQSIIRMYLERKHTTICSKYHSSAKTIQALVKWWVTSRTWCKSIAAIRRQKEEAWEKEMARFKMSWNEIKLYRRVVVHIPSISIDSATRSKMSNYSIHQNLQLARLCAIADPLVDIIYVSPFDLSDDVRGYYMKLMELGGISDPESRIRIVTPERLFDYPDHFSLSTVLLYSPICMKKIKRYIRRKEAYLVMGVLNEDDKRVAVALNIPILGMNPSQASYYNTKSACKRIFMEAQVNVPIGSYDIYEIDDLILVITKLIINHITIAQWLVKVDNCDYDEKGVFILNINDMKSVLKIRTEKRINEAEDPFYFQDEDVLLNAQISIKYELDNNCNKLFKPLFPNYDWDWNKFRKGINKYGAVIEAKSENIKGYFRSNLFIEPSGEVHVTSSHDRVQSKENPAQFLGSTFPQSMVPYQALEGASMSIGKVLTSKGICGYVTIDFMTFMDSKEEGTSNEKIQRIMALDIKPYLTNTAIGYVLFNFIVGGQYSAKSGKYFSIHQTPSTSEKVNENQTNLENVIKSERYYTFQEYIYHPNISTMPYNSFFNACRLDGISFDVENKYGTLFSLSDSLSGGVIGILSVGRNLKDTYRFMYNGLQMIKRTVGATEKSYSKIYGNFNLIFNAIQVYYQKFGGRVNQRHGTLRIIK